MFEAYRRAGIMNSISEHYFNVSNKKCKCIDPPPDTQFRKDGIYSWGYMIDGYSVYLDSGESYG